MLMPEPFSIGKDSKAAAMLRAQLLALADGRMSCPSPRSPLESNSIHIPQRRVVSSIPGARVHAFSYVKRGASSNLSK